MGLRQLLRMKSHDCSLQKMPSYPVPDEGKAHEAEVLEKAYSKFPNDKPKHISVRISPGHMDSSGDPSLVRAILIRKDNRRASRGFSEYYGDLAENVEDALIRLRDKVTEF